MIYSGSELGVLAQTYCQHQQITLARLGEMVCENHKFFKNLVSGKGPNEQKAQRATDWFLANWPDEADWPPDVVRSPVLTNEAA